MKKTLPKKHKKDVIFNCRAGLRQIKVRQSPRVFALSISITIFSLLFSPLQVNAGMLLQDQNSNQTIGAVKPIPLTPGKQAIIDAGGDCLRLRDLPAVNGIKLDCVADKTVIDVLEGAVVANDYRWQKVSVNGIIGWMADEFLKPYDDEPKCTSSAAITQAILPPVAATSIEPKPIKPKFSAPLPSSGFSLQLWSGGSMNDLVDAARTEGCNTDSVFTIVHGKFLAYKPGAPNFVNQPWFNHFGGETLSSGTILIMKCVPKDNVSSATASITNTNETFINPPQKITSVEAPVVNSRAAVIIDDRSGAILYNLNAHQNLPPASLTKIATAIIAIEEGNLDTWVESDVDSNAMIGSSVMGLLPGDCLQLRDLLHGLMLPSGNDAAITIARHLAGNESAFAGHMNALMNRLNLKDSHFKNSHGLDESGHLASAYDLAMLSRHAMTLPDFANTAQTTTWVAKGSRTFYMRNGNAFLRTYAGADGVKTGNTDLAGRTFVGSVTRNGNRVFVVLLNSPDRYGEATTLMDWVFENHEW